MVSGTDLVHSAVSNWVPSNEDAMQEIYCLISTLSSSTPLNVRYCLFKCDLWLSMPFAGTTQLCPIDFLFNYDRRCCSTTHNQIETIVVATQRATASNKAQHQQCSVSAMFVDSLKTAQKCLVWTFNEYTLPFATPFIVGSIEVNTRCLLKGDDKS